MGTNMKICRIVLYGYVGCSEALGETTNYLSGFLNISNHTDTVPIPTWLVKHCLELVVSYTIGL